MHAPCKRHMKAAMHVLLYLKNNSAQGLFFPSQHDSSLCAFCDSDCGGCHASQKSTTGYCVFWNPPSSLDKQRSKRQFLYP